MSSQPLSSGEEKTRSPDPRSNADAVTDTVANQTGEPVPAGFFGAALDRLARSVGRWPERVIVHTAEAISPVQVLLTGSQPCGFNDGEPVFAADAEDHRAVVSIEEYRIALKALAT
jgi:hypothetical protein